MTPSPKTPASFSERLLFVLFIAGLCLLAFVGGAVVVRYNLPASQLLTEAFKGGEAWRERIKTERSMTPVVHGLDNAIAHSKITWDKKNALDGYTLVTTWADSGAYLLDMEGKVVYKWSKPFSDVWPNPPQVAVPADDNRIFWEKAQAFPNGDLIATYITIGDTPYGYGLVKLDKNSRVIWKYDANTHHDFYVGEGDGKVYTLTQSFIKQPEKGLEDLNYPVLADAVAILSPEGKELKRIRLIDAFRGTPYELMLHHQKGWDQFHANSVMRLEANIADKFPMFKAGHLLVSIRNMSALVMIDPDTGKVEWARKGMWEGQHAAHFLPNGHILMLDNRGHLSNGQTYSRLLEIDPATTGVAWSFVGGEDQPFFSPVIGRVQRLANGNTLSMEGMRSRIFEITSDGQVVWDYQLPKVMQANNLRGGAKKKKGKRQDGGSRYITIVSAMRYTPDELPFLKEENLKKPEAAQQQEPQKAEAAKKPKNKKR